MQLTSVLALVLIPTVLSAPAVIHDKNGDSDTTNKGPSDTLQLDQTGFNNHQPIINLQNSEPRRGQSEFAAEKNGGPEVKRSERVDVKDEVDVEDEAVSKNMELADEEVKAVLKTFFRNLKRHPEIVEDILEREGAKLMAGQVQEGGEEEQHDEDNQSAPEESEERHLADEDNTGSLPLDISDFQKPSPQLMKVPKQVEKKAGPFAGQPQFIYKSPMRNTKERDELTARSMNNPANTIVVSDNNPANNIDNTGTPGQMDIGNAIPVIHQTESKEDPSDDAEALLTNIQEGDDINMAELERAEEEYSREHPFMNTLPIFPVKPTNQEESQVEADTEQAVELSEESEEGKGAEADDNDGEEPQSKRSKPKVTSGEESKETETDSGPDESGGKWAETQVDENTSDESEGSQVQKAWRELHPDPYYYYYNEDEVKDESDQLNASEEGDEEDNNAGQDSDEMELQKISQEAGMDEEEEIGASDDSKEQSVEGETEDTDEPEADEQEDDDVINNNHLADETGEKAGQISEAAEAIKKNHNTDKNEADLLALFRNSQQKTANLPVAGPPM